MGHTDQRLLYTIEQAAAKLTVSPATVRREWKRGALAPPIRVGRQLRWTDADLQDYLDEHRDQPVAPAA